MLIDREYENTEKTLKQLKGEYDKKVKKKEKV